MGEGNFGAATPILEKLVFIRAKCVEGVTETKPHRNGAGLSFREAESH